MEQDLHPGRFCRFVPRAVDVLEPLPVPMEHPGADRRECAFPGRSAVFLWWTCPLRTIFPETFTVACPGGRLPEWSPARTVPDRVPALFTPPRCTQQCSGLGPLVDEHVAAMIF